MKEFIFRYFLYLIRWQLSTPVLWFVLVLTSSIIGNFWATFAANLIGGLVFFWVDRLIFTCRPDGDVWEFKLDIKCADCEMVCTGRRLVKTINYDRMFHKAPEFRCRDCSSKKLVELAKKGIIVETFPETILSERKLKWGSQE